MDFDVAHRAHGFGARFLREGAPPRDALDAQAHAHTIVVDDRYVAFGVGIGTAGGDPINRIAREELEPFCEALFIQQPRPPWIETGELLIWNRTPARAVELSRLVQERAPTQHVTVLEGSEEAELAAWGRASDVVLCVPEEAARDARRIAAWQQANRKAGRIVHLGLGDGASPAWAGVAGLTSLVALFDMLRSQQDQRALQVRRARRACAEKALLRSLGTSTTQAHGWEDLAAFATIAS